MNILDRLSSLRLSHFSSLYFFDTNQFVYTILLDECIYFFTARSCFYQIHVNQRFSLMNKTFIFNCYTKVSNSRQSKIKMFIFFSHFLRHSVDLATARSDLDQCFQDTY